MSLTHKGINRIAKEFPTLARQCQLDIAKEFKEFIEQELQQQHHTGRNIYGERYPKPKKGNPPMFDTGELSQAYDVQVMSNGTRIVVRSESAHTIVSSDGKHTHLPDSRGMPPRWKQRLEIIQRKHFQKLMWTIVRLG